MPADLVASGTWVLFEVGGQLCALPADRIAGVIDPPPVTPVPFAPTHVEGLIGASGNVLPLIDLTARLYPGRTGPRGNDGVVLKISSSVAPFTARVVRVIQLAGIDSSSTLEAVGPGDGELPLAVMGTWRWQDKTVLLLDTDCLGVDDVAPANVPDGDAGIVGQTTAGQGAAAETRLDPVVVVEVGGESYALPIEAVREVVEGAERTPVPRAPEEVIGVALLRGEPLLLLSFARLLNRADSGSEAFMVVSFGTYRFGLTVDRLVGIRRFRSRNQHTVLESLQGLDGYYVDDGGGVVGAVDLERLVDGRLLAAFRNFAPIATETVEKKEDAEARQFLTFTAGGELCALAIDSIDRVVAYSEPVRLPNGGSDTVHGALEVQGQVVPVAEVQRRLAVGRAIVEPGAYVVVRLNGGACALAVDRVFRIVAIPAGAIEQIGTGDDLISEIGRLGDRLFWILSAERLAGVAA